jgi:hypothetical protein
VSVCQACGHPTSPQDPPAHVDGFVIHGSHLSDPRSGFHGRTPDIEEEK